MDSVVRKISIGSDYKNDAMHYSLGQEVYGGHVIKYILFDDINDISSIDDICSKATDWLILLKKKRATNKRR